MGITIYAAIVCLALTCSAHIFPLPPPQGPGVHARGLNRLLRARDLNGPPIRLSPREAEPTQWHTSSTRGGNPPRSDFKSPTRANSAPPRPVQAALPNSPDSLYRLKSAPDTLSWGSKSPGTSRHASPAKLRDVLKINSPGPSTERVGKGAKRKGAQQPAERPNELTKEKGKTNVHTKLAHTSTREEGTRPAGVQSYDRTAHDSGARPSKPSAAQRSSKATTISKSLLSEQSQARLIEHDQWLMETKDSIRKAEASAARMSRGNKRLQRDQSAQMIEATITANRFKTNSKRSRTVAKEALLRADQLLNTVPASDSSAQACLSSMDYQVRSACAAGAMHAKMEREAAVTATKDKQWGITADHVKASAKAMTRARAFEAQNTALLAQYKAKADAEKIKSLPPGDPQREKADKNAKLLQADYQDKVTFYKSVHNQYRQTRKDFAGSESEDEERIFPNISP